MLAAQAREDRAQRRAQPEGILRAGRGNQAQRQNNEDQENIPPNINNITVVGAGLDTFIPTIPEVRESDIKAKFPLQTLTIIDGRPTYEKMLNCERELGKNALAVDVPFRGVNRGCLGTVYSTTKYLTGGGWSGTPQNPREPIPPSQRMRRKMTRKGRFLPPHQAREGDQDCKNL